MAQTAAAQPINYGSVAEYDRWLATQDVPVYRDYYVPDLREVERGWWSLRGCPAAVLNLVGYQGITESRVLEIPPGTTIPPFRMALEEIIYVAEGQGLATVWAEGYPKVSFEWQKHSLFRIPNNYYYELSNTRGNQRALTLHISYLPLALSINPNPEAFFNNPYVNPRELYEGDGFYSAEAKAVRTSRPGNGAASETWFANFFPDLTLWDKLEAYGGAGRMAYSGGIAFPNSAVRSGLMVLPSRRYRAAHRHGPGVTIVGIQAANGFIIMWPEGAKREDYVIAPWQEGSVFVPPNQWYHMHVNTGTVENRQLRIFPPRPLRYNVMWGNAPDLRQVIPFVQEEPWIREMFESELAKRGLTSLMPAEGYTNPDFEWDEDFLKDD